MIYMLEDEAGIRNFVIYALESSGMTAKGFETPSRINMVHHLSAKSVQDLGKGESIKDYDHLPEKIRCGAATVKFLIEHEDFDIKPKIGIDLTKQKNADD